MIYLKAENLEPCIIFKLSAALSPLASWPALNWPWARFETNLVRGRLGVGRRVMDQPGRMKKTDVIKRSIFINGHKTSVSLENEFWQGLREIAEHDRTTVAMLVERIDRARNTCNLSSAIRVFVFNHFRDEKNSGGEKHHPALVVA
ncbi:MAG: ribbon-helix-helix domain-containing protein [Pseudolabrys sp.]